MGNLQISSADFAKRLKNMRAGILKYRNEDSTVANMVWIFRNGLLDKLRSSGTSPELFECFGELFVLETESENLFVRQCLNKAIERLKLSKKDEFFFKGNLTDTLTKTSFGHAREIQYLIHIHRPFDWKTPKEMTENKKMNKLARRLNEAYEEERRKG
jgi:hypothetical protein